MARPHRDLDIRLVCHPLPHHPGPSLHVGSLRPLSSLRRASSPNPRHLHRSHRLHRARSRISNASAGACPRPHGRRTGVHLLRSVSRRPSRRSLAGSAGYVHRQRPDDHLAPAKPHLLPGLLLRGPLLAHGSLTPAAGSDPEGTNPHCRGRCMINNRSHSPNLFPASGSSPTC